MQVVLPFLKCSQRLLQKRLREKQILLTRLLIFALICYVQSVYSNYDTQFVKVSKFVWQFLQIGLARTQARAH